MVFSDLRAGTPFLFGKVNVEKWFRNEGYRYVDENLTWYKTHDNGLSVLMSRTPSMSFDYPRPGTGTNRYERMHGQRLFSQSSLCKYLNTRDTSWSVTNESDGRPYGFGGTGFLSRFTTEEMEYLQPFTLTQQVPAGMTKKYGTSVSTTVLAGIPTVAQVGDGYDIAGTFGRFENSYHSQINGWLLDSNTMCSIKRYQRVSKAGGDYVQNVPVVIKIKDDAPVDRAENGAYIIRVPEEAFNGDLETFLGLVA